jgi:DNA-binding transcriptional regulator YiaG
MIGSLTAGRRMNPADLRTARKRLGLSTNGLAEALRLGKGGGRTVRRWEAGDTPISGPASLAIEMLLQREQK